MKFVIKDKYNNTVDSLEKYPRPQGGDRQWNKNRSAYKLAEYLINGNGELPKEIEEIIKPYVKEDKEIVLYPEHVTSFGNGWGKGTGRHHDALLVGENFVVGIEAKVDEPYGQKYMSQVDLAKTRYKRIIEEILNDKIDNLDKIRYQLCSAMLGTLMEAKENQVAILLVIVFKSTAGNLKKNDCDFEAFINGLEKSAAQDEYKQNIAKNVQFFVKKVEIQ